MTTKINVDEKYENNILEKLGKYKFESSSEPSKKEKLIRTFALYLLKDRWTKKFFDLEEDRAFLINYLAAFMNDDWGFPLLWKNEKTTFCPNDLISDWLTMSK